MDKCIARAKVGGLTKSEAGLVNITLEEIAKSLKLDDIR